MSARSGALALCVATFAATTPALAQRVRGTLRDSATREPVPGAVVTVTDSAGQFLARSVSDEAGRFAVPRLPASRRLHIVRIGYRPHDGLVPAGDADSADVRMVAIPSLLAAVSSSGKRVCPGDKTDAGALELWEQARAALLAGVVSRESKAPHIRLRSFWRTFDPVRKKPLDDSTVIKDVIVEKSYVAARPAWAFAEEGYMRESTGGDREYFAPDDAVLLDPTFAATHCLRTVGADPSHPSQVGIGFEPVLAGRPDTIVEVTGVLWMDQAKPALRALEFRYTNLESYAKNSGGEIHFALMPNGVPMIDRWTIHSVILAFDEEFAPNGIKKRPPPRELRTNNRLLAYQDVGGEIAFVDWNDGKHWGADLPRFTGVVTDTAGNRVAGARVWMRNMADTAITGPDGTFKLPYTFTGDYVVLASDSTLATQGISRSIPRPVRLLAPGNWDLWITLHPRSVVLPLVCPPKTYKPGTGVVVARAVDAAGVAVAGAQIDMETRQAIVAGDTVYQPRRGNGEAGDDGRFVICGAALDQPLVVRASKGAKSATAAVTAWKDEVMTLTLVLKDSKP